MLGLLGTLGSLRVIEAFNTHTHNVAACDMLKWHRGLSLPRCSATVDAATLQ